MAPAFDEVLSAAKRSAVHLEMRDTYMLDDPWFLAWRTGDFDVDDPGNQWWPKLIRETVARGVQVRRARIVSEPISDYVRFEYDITGRHNVEPGEQVRWLPRRQAAELALPGADFWLFDDETVMFNHFDGNGQWAEPGIELRNEPAVAKLCRSAFEAVWDRAVPHADYRPA